MKLSTYKWLLLNRNNYLEPYNYLEFLKPYNNVQIIYIR